MRYEAGWLLSCWARVLVPWLVMTTMAMAMAMGARILESEISTEARGMGFHVKRLAQWLRLESRMSEVNKTIFFLYLKNQRVEVGSSSRRRERSSGQILPFQPI